MDHIILVFAFTAGMAAFFNPCSVALLPAYLSYFLGRDESSGGYRKGALTGALIGATATLAFVTIFATTGLILSYVGQGIVRYIPWLTILFGIILISMGFLMLINRPIPTLPIKNPFKISKGRGYLSFYMFGIGYGIGSLACTLPIFLMVVFQAMSSGGLTEGFLTFLFFSFGMGFMMILATMGVAISKEWMFKYLKFFASRIKKLSGLILIAAGIYLIIYWRSVIYPILNY